MGFLGALGLPLEAGGWQTTGTAHAAGRVVPLDTSDVIVVALAGGDVLDTHVDPGWWGYRVLGV